MKYSELPGLGEVGVLDYYNPADADLSDLRYDSRVVQPGSTFFAVKGFQSDGHRFIDRAIRQGATGVVLENASAFSKEDAKTHGVHWVLVSNARKALAIVSESFYGNPSAHLTLIGVTG